MRNFSEEALQFIWEHRLLKPPPFRTVSGKALLILDPGTLNPDAGPDFFNARIRLEDITLAGNIEIHKKTSDWLRHGHQSDRSYDTLILHVVYEHDLELEQNLRNRVEVLELRALIAPETLAFYEGRSVSGRLPCQAQLPQLSAADFTRWVQRMTMERLEARVERLEALFAAEGQDYRRVAYACIVRSFGFKVNALPFELLGRRLPLHLLLKHADNLMQLEALLLGTAGFLEEPSAEDHLQRLGHEFHYLRQKYGLEPLRKELFKFSRLRPANFPNVRLVQLAGLIHNHRDFFLNPRQVTAYEGLRKLLEISPEGYWKNHYTPGGRPQVRPLALGREAAESIMINALVPFFLFYSRRLNQPEYTNFAIELLTTCRPEINTRVRHFASRRGDLRNAAASQGLLHLYERYCEPGRCMKCGIAAAILAPPARKERPASPAFLHKT
jgi:hypothetical protein